MSRVGTARWSCFCVSGLRSGDAAALRVADVDLHRNAVTVGRQTFVGTLKSGKKRTLVLPGFVVDSLAETAEGKNRDELLWPSQSGGYLAPPRYQDKRRASVRASCQD